MFTWIDKGEYFVAECREKLSNGQTITIQFEEDKDDNYTTYNTVLFIKTKRKRKQWDYSQTGNKLGLEGLLWAKRKMIEFEEFIKEDDVHKHKDILIFVYWEDNRRRDIYARSLQPLGYNFSYFNGFKQLMKKIPKKDGD